MKVICSYCRKLMREEPPLGNDQVSHGMCEECYEYFSKMWGNLKLGEYFDQFDEPVIAVDDNGRILAANQHMADLLGKREREIYGLLGGEVFECQHARLPEGCGKTIHCETCTVRGAVTKTIETGEDQLHIPAYVNRDEADLLALIISTHKEPFGVRLVIEEIST